MNIAVIGTGYVGLVQGIIMADFNHNVTCVDIDIDKINRLQRGEVPIYEPGLEELLKKNILRKKITFTSNIKSAIKNSEIIFIAVGTPPAMDGSADLQYVLNVAREIGENIEDYKVIVNKSTVPIGTGELVKDTLEKELKKRNTPVEFDIVSNPEFLREGKAVEDCLNPDRIVIGYDSTKALNIMKELYGKLIEKNIPFVFTNIKTSEMIKYASNAFLAVKISFINEISLLAEKVGANTDDISLAMGMDNRISPKFLKCGPGYGGSCFPKDTKALVKIGDNVGEEMSVVKAAIYANEKQKFKIVEKIKKEMNGLEGKIIGILGLSFKPDTDDVRDAPSIDIIKHLINNGAKINAYCPKGMKEAKWRLHDFNNKILYCENEYEVSNKADSIVLITEWSQFENLDLNKMKKNMRDNFYFDLRNIHNKNTEIKKIFKYFPFGKKDHPIIS
ncbi:UDP-glucose/GDP-mannose dehydrogenase family protein [Fusobacterium sp. IOR10]|uniref:UDP-glucose dehydrogenase family protein n=1 Tax=Fusobacterium sp. IOR10 TaxID=2665157 RepID=UPI0013D69571|nr:UDP-glucose/GDP-mannose dehydrogenase family protein [Fusobacterium sp. IOR10]